MAAPAPKRAKSGRSESLAIRLDPKTRFILDFVSRAKGQTITTVVERAIYEAASNVTVDVDFDRVNWQSVWNESVGTLALRMAAIKDLYPTYEEERRLNFARLHWPFFFTDERAKIVQTWYVDILWPRIDEFMQINDDSKQTDAYAAGKAMQEALANAKVKPPEWPPAPPPPKPKASPSSRDLDDEIPF